MVKQGIFEAGRLPQIEGEVNREADYGFSGTTGAPSRATKQRWATFVQNHAQTLAACDFCVVVTATFRVLYVFVALEIGSRRLRHVSATTHPTAAWTLPQVREILAEAHGYRFVLHERDSIYSPWLDAGVTAMGVRILRTPVQAPLANCSCERLLGTLRRECLDYLIPFGEDHLRRILGVWKVPYNRGRPHAGLGPGLPEPSPGVPASLLAGHRLPRKTRVVARAILGGLHHEYSQERRAARPDERMNLRRTGNRPSQCTPEAPALARARRMRGTRGTTPR